MCQRQHMNMSIAGHFHVSAGFLLMMWCDGGEGALLHRIVVLHTVAVFISKVLNFTLTCVLFWHWFSLTTSVSVTMKVWRWFFYPHNKAVRADISTGSLHRTCLYCRGKPHRKRKLSSTLNLDYVWVWWSVSQQEDNMEITALCVTLCEYWVCL